MSYNKYYTPTSWENYPSENTAINATRLNHLEDGVDELDDRIVNLSTNKSEVLWNQTLIAGQKIAEITINGIQKNVYAPEISDSIVEEAEEQALKAEGYAVGEQYGIPVSSGTYYHNNAKYYSEESADDALISEGYANGTQNGEDVDPDSPYYHNNAKFWSEQKAGTVIKNTTGQFYTTTGGMLDSCVVALSPKQSGSGTPSPSNIRPITGHSSVEVTNVGKNKLPMTVSRIKSINTSGTWSGNVYTYRGVVFTILTDSDNNVIGIKANRTESSSNHADFRIYDFATTSAMIMNGVPSGGASSTYYMQMSGTSYMTTGSDVSIPSGVSGLIYIRINSGYSASNLIFYPMIRLATDTDANFEPYQEQNITVSLGNTYYGGTLDFVSGVLTVTHAFVEYDGSNDEDWTNGSVRTGSEKRKRVTAPTGIKKPSQNTDVINAISNMYSVVSASNTYDKTQGIACDISGYFFIYDSNYNTEDLATWKSFLANNPLQVAYELATPLIIQLSPSQINTLVGQNNISAPLDGQSFASAEYRDNMSVVYITDERVVGKWIDGKDIYQRTIDLGSSGVSVPANSSASTGLAKGNVELPIWSTAISPSGQAFPHIGCSVGSTYIMMENKTGNATTVRYFTFQYTKTS